MKLPWPLVGYADSEESVAVLLYYYYYYYYYLSSHLKYWYKNTDQVTQNTNDNTKSKNIQIRQ